MWRQAGHAAASALHFMETWDFTPSPPTPVPVVCCCSGAVAGSMDSGKSTLVAVLTHGADGRPLLDNGRGSARMAVFRHKHEIESGRTSSISQQVGAGCCGMCFKFTRSWLSGH